MENEAAKTQVPQFLREVTEDVSVLTRMSVANAAMRIRQIIDDERRQLSATMLRALLSLPIIIMATLFAGAAAVEWLANVFPLPLASVYAVAALCFAPPGARNFGMAKKAGKKMTDPTQNYGFQELRRAARAKQRLLGNLKQLESVASSTAGPAVAASLAARRAIRSAPILSITAVCVAGYLAGRRTSRHPTYDYHQNQDPKTSPIYQRNPIWAGLAGAGLQLWLTV